MINAIKIQKVKNRNQFRICSRNDLFKCKELTIAIKEDVIILRRPILSDIKTYKIVIEKLYNVISVSNQFLKEGIFDIDLDDSTEDELVIYLD